jgi:hypothetical protein
MVGEEKPDGLNHRYNCISSDQEDDLAGFCPNKL